MFNLINNNNKEKNMKTLRKIGFLILSSVFVFANANAGELSVTGGAKATYVITSSDGSETDDSAGKGLGLTNEFTLAANGELDNGFTWSYGLDIDDATAQDDARLVIGMGGLGTVKLNISDGGIQKNFFACKSAYGCSVDNGEGGSYTDSSDTGAMNGLRYTTPSGLPFDAVVNVQYAPSTGLNATASGNSAGTLDAGAEDAIAYSLDITPIEGLSLAASYFDPDSPAKAQQHEGGAWGAVYTMGAFTLGYGQSYEAPGLDTNTTNDAEDYQNRILSVAFNVNDALSVSYEDISAEKNYETSSSDVEMDVESIQASYTIGGMTLSLANEEYDNHDYTTGNKMKETTFAMSIAF